jgi:threonine aldolase
MYSFRNDYSELCHEEILNTLAKVNRKQFDGYGEDELTSKVKKTLSKLLDNNNVDIHFLSGGTQTNLVAISSVLKPYQAVIAAQSGHIATHEAGAIEATGHKIITLPTVDGKLNALDIKKVVEDHYSDEAREHISQPAMVYISNPSEYGTIYKKCELEEIRKVCDQFNLILYMDGARLAQGLESTYSDLKMKDLTKYFDMFYIGGTKNGAMFGECLVVVNPSLKKDFRYNLKQRGALLAKGFSVALQFEALFKDDLFFKLAKDANRKAKIINDELISSCNIKMLVPCETNQVFPILSNNVIEKLRQEFQFYDWEKVDDNNTAVRLCLSWASEEDKIHEFILNIKEYLNR